MALRKNRTASAHTLTGWRKLTAELSFMAVVIQLLLPLTLATFVPVNAEAAAAPRIAICTPTGIVYQDVGQDRQSVPSSADCPFCQVQHMAVGLVPPAHLDVATPDVVRTRWTTSHAKLLQPPRQACGNPSRAPPQ